MVSPDIFTLVFGTIDLVTVKVECTFTNGRYFDWNDLCIKDANFVSWKASFALSDNYNYYGWNNIGFRVWLKPWGVPYDAYGYFTVENVGGMVRLRDDF